MRIDTLPVRLVVVSVFALLVVNRARADTLFVSDYGQGVSGAGAISVIANQVVSTFASGLTEPTGIAFDSSGNLYVGCETVVNGFLQPAIDKITSNKTVTVFASDLTDHVEDIAFDKSGNLYAATSNASALQGGGAIDKITPSGGKSIFVTLPPTSIVGDVGLTGLAFDGQGNLFAADFKTIYKITPSGSASTFVTLPNVNQFNDADIVGLAFDKAGNLYADAGNVIEQISPAGAIRQFAAVNIEDNAFGNAFDSAGYLFVGLGPASAVDDILPDGSGVSVWANIPNGPRYIADPSVSLPVPEPAGVTILLAGTITFLSRRRSQSKKEML